MRRPDEVAAMVERKRRGWGAKRIAREFGTCPQTVRRYVRQGSWVGDARAGLDGWLGERLVRHGGNADVVRQERACARGMKVRLRTVERACAPFRQRLEAAARARIRFETPRGRQLQIDFAERRVKIGEDVVRADLFVATLFVANLFVATLFVEPWAFHGGCMSGRFAAVDTEGRSPGKLVLWHAERFRIVRWDDRRGAVRQRARPGRAA